MAKVPAKPSSKGAPPAPIATVGNLEKAEPGELVALKFKVLMPVKKEFKITAAELDMDMVELFYECFAAFGSPRIPCGDAW